MGEGVNSYTEKLFGGISSLMEESCRISGRAGEERGEGSACRARPRGQRRSHAELADLGHCASHGRDERPRRAPTSPWGFHPSPGARGCFCSVPKRAEGRKDELSSPSSAGAAIQSPRASDARAMEKVGQAHWTPCAPPLLSHSLSQPRW